MSEQNILNPAGSDLNPDFPLPMPGLNPPLSVFQPRSGSPIKRIQGESGRIIPLTWTKRGRSVRDRLVQWEAQYKTGFFSFYHAELGRYFSGSFADNLQPVQVGYEQWNISGTFVEMPGVAMFQYFGATAGDWIRDGILLEDRDAFGAQLVKLNGAGWAPVANAQSHGGTSYGSNVPGDSAEWIYFGYGCRVWSPKQNDLGKTDVILDGVTVEQFDGYSAGVVNSAAVSGVNTLNVKLGTHRLKLFNTGIKNVASSNFFIYADALEVMQ